MLMRKDSHAPELHSKLPGPNAERLIAEDERFTSPSYTRPYPLAIARGEGAVIEDVDGNRFLDFTSGIAVCSTGHCHPRVVAAIQEQAGKLIHMSGTDFYYGPQAELAKKLAEIAPGKSPKRVFFTNSGTESIEAAIKLARHATGRPFLLAFYGAFHGRTMGSLSLTCSKVVQRRGFEPLLPGVLHAHYPNPYRCRSGRTPEDCWLDTIEEIEQDLFVHRVSPQDVAAIFVEPIQGEGGYLVPPPEFHRRLKELTERHGILYVADEVQSGMGRTGKMFASEHWGVEPDIVCTAKGIASGMPLGAMIARSDIMTWKPGSHASTFGGNPVSCVAALETIALLEEELIHNAEQMGDFLRERLREMQTRHPLIGDVRGKGLMIGVELVRNRITKERAIKERDQLVWLCFENGLLLLGCGRNTVRFAPPLIIDEAQCEAALEIFEAAIADVEASLGLGA